MSVKAGQSFFCTLGRNEVKSTVRILGYMKVHSLGSLAQSLASLCLLGSRALLRSFVRSHAFSFAIQHKWERDLHHWIQCVDSIQFLNILWVSQCFDAMKKESLKSGKRTKRSVYGLWPVNSTREAPTERTGRRSKWLFVASTHVEVIWSWIKRN